MNYETAERPLGYYQTPDKQIIRISELDPDRRADESLYQLAAGIAQTLHLAWQAKFTPDVLLEHEVANKVPDAYAQMLRIQRAAGTARYLVSAVGREPLTAPEEVRAFVRVEAYTPRAPRPGNWLRRPYPNVTDLESRSGKLYEGPHIIDARALLYHALEGAHPNRKTAAYTEAANPDGREFFTSLGYEERGRPTEIIGNRQVDGRPAVPTYMEYVHMEAERTAPVQQLLAEMLSHQSAE